jgi:hypothetical protein
VEARNELEAALYSASDYATTTSNVKLGEVVAAQRAWLEIAPAATPVAAFRSKQLELQTTLASA